jgi:hypothetical protein
VAVCEHRILANENLPIRFGGGERSALHTHTALGRKIGNDFFILGHDFYLARYTAPTL